MQNITGLVTTILDVPSAVVRPSAPRVRGFFAHHGVWAPGVRVFRQLTFRSKAILISLVFLVPIVALSLQYARQSAELLRSNENAKIGVAYASELLPLLKLMQQQRWAILQQGGADSSTTEVKATADAIAAQFRRVIELDARHGALLHTKEPLDVLRANMEKAATQQGSKNLLAIHKRQSQSIDAALALLDAVLDGSGLTLDPDADTNRLMQTGLAQLPRLTESTLASVDLGLAAAKGANPQTSAKLMAPLHAVGVYLDTQILLSLDKLVAAHPELAQRIAYAATQEARSKVDELVSGLGEDGWTAELAALASARVAMVERSSALQVAIVAELQARQQARIDRVWFEGALLLSVLTAAMLLASYMFLSFSRVMQGGLNEVRRHLRAMTQGDLTTSPSPWGDDEAAQLMLELRDMQDSLRGMVLRVRRSSDEIVHSSSEISSGALDLSARTEQAAANLEQSAASMEEIASTVKSTAEHTQEASRVARHNAQTASDGGRVMGDVVQTMEGIRAASSKIGEISGTIDNLAFQTNILALNAAVEAARAGDRGRGFAVVASEVRALAQRSAQAAREIKGLIAGSLEQVEAGTTVVRGARTTIEEIVASSQRVDRLLDEVATGAREQSLGVGQIGQAVQELDRMTQQNAAMVEQTAAAASAMKEQAHTLAEEVARFRIPEELAVAEAAGPVADFDFDKAIEAHRQWKVKLRKAIAEHDKLDSDTICRDDQCPLGKWIHGPGGAQWGSRPSFVELMKKHAEFHQTAGAVARQINAGNYAEAEKLIGSGSQFARSSTEVATILTRAKRGL